MAYISKPLVRKFRILKIRRLDVFKFETILRNQLTWHVFFASSIFSFYKHQVTSLIWHVCFTRQTFNIFWMVNLC